MIKIHMLIIAALFITACSSSPDKNIIKQVSDSPENIKRTKKLFACSRFFEIIASQRPQDAKEYIKLSQQSKDLGLKIISSSIKGGGEIDSKLITKYIHHGNYQSIQWLKEIGNDKTEKRYPQITIDCYKTNQLEALFEIVEDINQKL